MGWNFNSRLPAQKSFLTLTSGGDQRQRDQGERLERALLGQAAHPPRPGRLPAALRLHPQARHQHHREAHLTIVNFSNFRPNDTPLTPATN